MALLRYPGGKSKYTDFILPVLYKLSGFSVYVEPFVGGGSVSLAMAAKHPNVKLVLNDFDQGVAAFWDLIANAPESEFQSLEDRILNTQPTVAIFKEMLESNPSDRAGRAFRAFFLNRTSFGGMGWRPLGGWEQTSEGKIDSRWGCAKKILELRQARRLLHGRTKVLNADFASVIPLAHAKALMFLDPQYYEAGNELYNFTWSDADHVRLRDALKHRTNWVMSYDDHPRIRELYPALAFHMAVKYSGGKRRKKTNELLLSPRLEFPTDPSGDTLRIWVEGYGPYD
jgi:DNA adenine methylase